MRIEAVFFDFGGTLFSYRDTGPAHFGLILRAAKRLGVSREPHELGRLYRQASADSFREFAPKPYYLHRELFAHTFRRFAVAAGAEPTAELVDWFHAAQRDVVRDGFKLRDGCVETLKALRERELGVAIVSNIDDDFLHPMLERVGLPEHLDAWTSSEEARSCKPDPGIFELACRKAGVEPAAVLFVGDSRQADIAGGRALGMTTVWIRDSMPAPGEDAGELGEPHYEIEALPELLDVIEQTSSFP